MLSSVPTLLRLTCRRLLRHKTYSLLDVVGLADWWGAERVGVVGHDLGGMVAWALGALAPQRVDRMVVLSSPHPMRFREVGRGNVDQIRRAFYVWLMHAGEAGERLLASDDFMLLSCWAFGRSAAVTEEKRAARASAHSPSSTATRAGSADR